MEATERNTEEEVIEVWRWGAGTEGQLGTGKLQDEHVPQLIPSLPSFSLLSCGGSHVIALTPGNKVLTWGRGTSGQLGHGDTISCLQPNVVEILNNFNIIHVSAGWNHSGFVSESGCLFTCGDGSFGQLGHGDFLSKCSPTKVSFFSSRHVFQIASGMRHSIALLKGPHGDQVYGFGSGKRGQLGISEDKVKSINLPQITLGLEDIDIASINANGDHSAALSVEGHFYTWGRGFDGSSDECCPNRVKSPLSFTKAALGWNHALVLTGDGNVLMLGGSHHGILSDPRETNSAKLRSTDADESNNDPIEKVGSLNGTTVVDVAAGAEHSALVTDNGVVMTWGWGEHGQLGLGTTTDYTAPQIVSFSKNLANVCSTSKVYCGSGFTFVARKRNSLIPDPKVETVDEDSLI